MYLSKAKALHVVVRSATIPARLAALFEIVGLKEDGLLTVTDKSSIRDQLRSWVQLDVSLIHVPW